MRSAQFDRKARLTLEELVPLSPITTQSALSHTGDTKTHMTALNLIRLLASTLSEAGIASIEISISILVWPS
jgi:hypothetical protein